LTEAPQKTILVVDDEASIRESLQRVLEREGYRVVLAEQASEALRLLEEETIQVALVDLKLPGEDGLSLLKKIKSRHSAVEVILITGYGTIETAVEAMKQGAYDFITKPFRRAVIVRAVAKAAERQELVLENRFLRQQLEATTGPLKIIGRSRAMEHVMHLVDKVAPLNSTVLITGESGTGKELIAKAIHAKSPRRNRRFVAINCGAIPENLMESELFGHLKGAFTGAHRDKEGLFKIASGGTLFLDEIGNIPPNLQIKLLRAIEEREILPVGSTRPIRVDIRIIAASNRDLAREVEEGRFREDLYYRLNVMEIHIPPLRERREDIPLLVDHFIHLHNGLLNKRVRGVDQETLHILMNYHWKGNVRELENVIERAMILCEGEVITPQHLPPNLMGSNETCQTSHGRLKDALRQFERQYIIKVLEQVNHDKKAAAQILGVSQSSLYRKLSELRIPL